MAAARSKVPPIFRYAMMPVTRQLWFQILAQGGRIAGDNLLYGLRSLSCITPYSEPRPLAAFVRGSAKSRQSVFGPEFEAT